VKAKRAVGWALVPCGFVGVLVSVFASFASAELWGWPGLIALGMVCLGLIGTSMVKG
jgi:hypothetical protein